ncbi:MAG: transglutaminase-like domain-containing protein, partial [Actinomycetota bacterium]
MSIGRFRSVMDAADLQLDEACLSISAAIRHPLDEIEWLATIDLIAGECPTPTAEGIARHLFGDLGFHGNAAAYHDWRNSCLDQVIERRTGIPITLSILMIEVGRRLGVPLVGIGMPAHFIVRHADHPDQFFDPFGGGVELDRAEARALFERVTGGRLEWQEQFLDPMIGQSIVVRVLNNLRSIFAARNDAVRLGVVMQLRGCI